MKQATFSKQAIAVLLTSSICLTSCSKMSDSTVTQIQAAAVTGGGAAAIGFVGAKLVGLNDRTAAYVAAGAAIVGILIGQRWGKSLVKKKEYYKQTEGYLNANINQLNKRTHQVAKLNRSLVSKISNAKKNKTSFSKAQRQAVAKDIDNKVGLIDTDIRTAQSAAAGSSAAQKADLLNRIKVLQGHRNALVKNSATLLSVTRQTV